MAAPDAAPPPPPPEPLEMPLVGAWATADALTFVLADGATDVPPGVALEVRIGARLPEAAAVLYDGRERPVPGRVDVDATSETRILVKPQRLAGSNRYRLEIAATPDGDSEWRPLSFGFRTSPAPERPRKNLQRRSKKRR